MATICVKGDDWPQWRGLNRDGVWKETRILQAFPPGGLKVSWRAPVGLGFSSPIVSHGRVYVTDSQLAAPKVRDRVHCFSESTGQLLWTYSQENFFPDWATKRGTEAMPNGTPIAGDGVVYAPGSLGHRLYCIEINKGKLLGEKNLAKEYQIEETAMLAASPLLEGNLLILALCGKPGAGVVAFDKTSGREVWRALDELTAHSSPIVITASGARQLIVWTLKSVNGLDPKTGKLLWRERLLGDSMSVVSTPVFSKSRLLLSGLMLKLGEDKPSVSVLWPETLKDRVLSSTSTPLVQDDCVFSADSNGKLVCLDINTGKRLWETNKVTDPKGSPGTTAMHMTAQGGSVLLFNEVGELIRAKLSAHGYEELSRVQLIEPTYPFSGRKLAWSAPAYANRRVFARNDKELICASLEAE